MTNSRITAIGQHSPSMLFKTGILLNQAVFNQRRCFFHHNSLAVFNVAVTQDRARSIVSAGIIVRGNSRLQKHQRPPTPRSFGFKRCEPNGRRLRAFRDQSSPDVQIIIFALNANSRFNYQGQTFRNFQILHQAIRVPLHRPAFIPPQRPADLGSRLSFPQSCEHH